MEGGEGGWATGGGLGGTVRVICGVGVASLHLPFCIYRLLHLSLVGSSLLEVHGVCF